MDIIKRNNVCIQGDGDAILLYAHGFGCSQAMWNRITPEFNHSHKQILFDYVGSGQSDLSAFNVERYSSLNGYAQDVIDICDALNLQENVTFVGHSVSCSIGLIACLLRPQLFNQFILIGASPCFINFPPDYMGGFEREDLVDLLALMDQNYLGWANYLAPIVAGEQQNGAISGELSDSFCSTDPLVAKTFAKATFFADNREEFARVLKPCLILQNSHDSLTPVSVGEYMHRQLKNSQLTIFDIAGHCAHRSHPALVIDAMKKNFCLQSNTR